VTAVGRLVGGIEAQARKPIEQHPDRDRELRAGEVVPDAVVRPDGEREARLPRPADVEPVGAGAPGLGVAIRGCDDEDDPGLRGQVHATQPRARCHPSEQVADRRRPAEALLDGNRDDAFTALVADLRGDIMLAQGRIDEARAAYKLASEKADPRNPVKGIVETKLNALGGAQ